MRLWVSLFCLAAGLDVLIGARNFGPLLHGVLVDPDSYMRLLRIEQGLRHGILANLVRRDDSGVPLVLEWSRLFDAALVAMAAPLAPFLGWHRALLAAGIASAPISAGLLGAAMGFAAAPFSGKRFLWSAPVIGMLLPGIRGYAGLGIVHYHIIMLAAVALTTGFAIRAREGDRRAACWAGITGGIALWIMPETMPFVLLAYTGLGWRWLFAPIGPALARLGTGFALTLALGAAIDPPHGGFFMAEIDRISIIYVGLGIAVCIVTLGLAGLDRLDLRRSSRIGLGIVIALGGFGTWLARYPLVALGPYGLMSAEDMRRFFGTMAETQPVHGVGEAFLLLGPGCFALGYCLLRAWRVHARMQPCGGWLIAALAILLSLGLTARFVIFQQFPAGFAAMLLPIALADASERFSIRPLRAAGTRIGLIFALLIVPYLPAFALADTSPAKPEPASCALRALAPLLAPAAGQIVLTTADEVPELLYRTRIIAVGSLYQHGVGAYLRARAAWRAPMSRAPSPALVATGARFVLFCPSAKRYALVRTAAHNTLWDALASGTPPPWLREAGLDKASGFRLYRVNLG